MIRWRGGCEDAPAGGWARLRASFFYGASSLFELSGKGREYLDELGNFD